MKNVLGAALTILLLTHAGLPARGADSNPPELMTYQGYLVDGNGNALAVSAPKNYDVVFRVYNSQTGGVLKWSEQQTVTVDKGYFSVMLGEGSPVGSEPRPLQLSSLFAAADGSDRFIGITVRGIGANGADVDILPRMQLLSAPYAFMARNASSLPTGAGVGAGNVVEFGQGVSGKEPNAGKIGYGSFTPGALDIVGAGTSGTNRQIKLWAEGGLTVGGDIALGLGGNDYRRLALGGGNSSGFLYGSFPALGDGVHLGYNAYHDAAGALRIPNTQLGTSRLSLGSGTLSLAVGGVNTAPSAELTLGANGVGVAADLAVAGSVRAAGAFRARGGAPGPNGEFLNGYAFEGGGGDTDSGMFSGGDGVVQFYSDSSEAMRINKGGNVGIGHTNPQAPLAFATVLGDKISLWGNGGNHYGFGIQSSLLQIHTDVPETDVAFGHGSSAAFTETMRIKGNGRVGIGTSSPGVPLHVAAPPVLVGLYDSPDGFSNDSGFNGAWPLGSVNGGNFFVSILANGWVAGGGMVANSDVRIKRVIGESDRARDLATVELLRVTDYSPVATAFEGAGKRKGFIAQEVEKIAPDAVTRRVDFIPDIYAAAEAVEKGSSKTALIRMAKEHGLASGDVVRLYVDNREAEATVGVVNSPREFSVDLGEAGPSGKVFVYGRRVDDFRSVNYDHIFTVGIGAIQELARRTRELETNAARIAELERKAGRVDELERELASLRAAVRELAAASGRPGPPELDSSGRGGPAVAVNSAAR